MKKYIVIIISLLLPALIAGCSRSDKTIMKTPLNPSEIDKVVVITSMGNPKYGADSKTITDSEEIYLFVESFNSARLDGKVESDDVGVAMPSHYYFYSGNELISEFSFNGNNSNIIWLDDNYYYIEYDDNLNSPYELYQNSTAKIMLVDEKGNVIDKSIDSSND